MHDYKLDFDSILYTQQIARILQNNEFRKDLHVIIHQQFWQNICYNKLSHSIYQGFDSQYILCIQICEAFV